MWRFTQYFDFEETKVVILGQDPYYNPGLADGLCFSLPREVEIPEYNCLQNIFGELEDDPNIDFEHPGHGCLEGWAKQGVLLVIKSLK